MSFSDTTYRQGGTVIDPGEQGDANNPSIEASSASTGWTFAESVAQPRGNSTAHTARTDARTKVAMTTKNER
eukprot:CAMPEP_0172433786 /NCGR_PEP_ID=MMETSP1064-20121228/69591_1 /TAXON_ID=202472 /ORGANISM="Aulacoseira subarctica , Strain CCAP 1002/5" /LENGTH=71 /DNA_ID=CAMNT_0013181883 /DNA_START=63 /DNA_END=275 /DNA_ORIENTATION=+